jgi:hypothetical protein
MGRGTRTLGPTPEMVPGGSRAGRLTCCSSVPLLTAGARCSPLPAGSACTHRVPAGSAPVRSRTPPALRSSAARDRSAGRARQGRSCTDHPGGGSPNDGGQLPLITGRCRRVGTRQPDKPGRTVDFELFRDVGHRSLTGRRCSWRSPPEVHAVGRSVCLPGCVPRVDRSNSQVPSR